MKKLYILLTVSLLCAFASSAQQTNTTSSENPLTKEGIKLDIEVHLGYTGFTSLTAEDPTDYYKLKGTFGGSLNAAAIYQTDEAFNFGAGCGILTYEFDETKGDSKSNRHSFGVPVFARLGIIDKIGKLHGFLNLDPGIMIGTHQMKTSFYFAMQVGIILERAGKIGISLTSAKADYKTKEIYGHDLENSLSIGITYGLRFAL